MSTTIPTNNVNVISFEDIKELFREVARQSQETDRQLKKQREETDRQIKETDRQLKETDRQLKETDRQCKKQHEETGRYIKETERQLREMFKKTDKKIAELGDRIGEIVESMVEGGIVDKFNELNYSFNFSKCARRFEFNNSKLNIAGEIDLLLMNDDTELLVEVKTSLSIEDVDDHIKRIENYRRCAGSTSGKRKIFGAVASGVNRKGAGEHALKRGLFFITQSGESFKIMSPPKGVKLKTW
jgi:chromosome segregation ATPase